MKDDKHWGLGDGAIEYGLIASLIAVAIFGIVVTLGPVLKTVYEAVTKSL